MRVGRPIVSSTGGALRTAKVRAHALELHNDCGPCCDCQDFINVYEAIRRLRSIYENLQLRAAEVLEDYSENRERFIKDQLCRDLRKLRVVMQAICPDELAIAVGYCNNTDECLENVTVVINFQYTDEPGEGCTAETTYEGTAEVLCDSTFRRGNISSDAPPPLSSFHGDPYQLGGSWPYYYAYWERVNPGDMATVSFRLDFANSQGGDKVEVVVDAYHTTPLLTAPGEELNIINGYEFGAGPTGEAALAVRLVDSCLQASTPLLQEPCCETLPGCPDLDGLLLCLEADGEKVLLDGNVLEWEDSVEGYVFAKQGAGSVIFNQNAGEGFSALYFGGDAELRFPVTGSGLEAKPLCVFIKFRPDSVGDPLTLFRVGQDTGTIAVGVLFEQTADKIRAAENDGANDIGPAESVSDLVVNEWSTGYTFWDADGQAVRLNDEVEVTIAEASVQPTWDYISIGSRLNVDRHFLGAIRRICVFDHKLTDAEYQYLKQIV
jgi:hypothetical protein